MTNFPFLLASPPPLLRSCDERIDAGALGGRHGLSLFRISFSSSSRNFLLIVFISCACLGVLTIFSSFVLGSYNDVDVTSWRGDRLFPLRFLQSLHRAFPDATSLGNCCVIAISRKHTGDLAGEVVLAFFFFFGFLTSWAGKTAAGAFFGPVVP